MQKFSRQFFIFWSVSMGVCLCASAGMAGDNFCAEALSAASTKNHKIIDGEVLGKNLSDTEQTYLRLIEASLKQNFIDVEDLQKLVAELDALRLRELEGRETEAAGAQGVADGSAKQRSVNQLSGALPNSLEGKTLTAASLPYFNALELVGKFSENLEERTSTEGRTKHSAQNLLIELKNILEKITGNQKIKDKIKEESRTTYGPHITLTIQIKSEMVHAAPRLFITKDGRELLAYGLADGSFYIMNLKGPQNPILYWLPKLAQSPTYFVAKDGRELLAVPISESRVSNLVLIDLKTMKVINKIEVLGYIRSAPIYFVTTDGREILTVVSDQNINLIDYNNPQQFNPIKIENQIFFSAPRYIVTTDGRELLEFWDAEKIYLLDVRHRTVARVDIIKTTNHVLFDKLIDNSSELDNFEITSDDEFLYLIDLKNPENSTKYNIGKKLISSAKLVAMPKGKVLVLLRAQENKFSGQATWLIDLKNSQYSKKVEISLSNPSDFEFFDTKWGQKFMVVRAEGLLYFFDLDDLRDPRIIPLGVEVGPLGSLHCFESSSGRKMIAVGVGLNFYLLDIFSVWTDQREVEK